jgi:hypothetical protein
MPPETMMTNPRDVDTKKDTATDAIPSLLTLLLLATVAPAWAGETPEEPKWTVGFGAFDVDSQQIRVQADLEYRFRPFSIGKVELVPAVGTASTEEGSSWVYGAVRYDFRITERWRFTPFTGISLYEPGGGKELGGAIEFRSGAELSYRVANGDRVGVMFYHLSNARIYDPNPGVNSLVLTWSF